MENIKNAIITENTKRLNDRLNMIKECKSVEEFLSYWMTRQLLTDLRQNQLSDNKLSLDDAKIIAEKKAIKESKKALEIELSKLETIATVTKEIKEITLSITWHKSATWGHNPNCEGKFVYIDNTCDYFNSTGVSGCGYDKESTATAQVLNQSKELLKLLYTKKNDSMDKNCFAYGVSNNYNPSFNGGVGFNCHRENLEQLGFTFKHVSSSKNFDVYLFTK